MLPVRFLPVVLKQVVRQRTRSLLTVAGVAVAMFLFCTVQAMQRGTEEATQATAKDTELIVYRKDRYCPFASRIPESYLQRITAMPNVVSVVPMKIVVSNCRTSLDVVTFRGVPEDRFIETYGDKVKLIAGSFEQWRQRTDAVLLGETLAARRGLKVGERFDAAGITAYVAGVIQSDEPQHQNVAYAHLAFLQRAAKAGGLGIVTQFNVRVSDPSHLQDVAARIDAEFAADQEPTQTRSEKQFVARAATDVLEIVGFTRWLGWGCLAAVLALVGNAIVLAVQDRIREHAVLQTLGFKGHLIARLILAESALLALLGALIGSLGAAAAIRWTRLSLSVDGLSIPIHADSMTVATGLGIAIVLGVFAGMLPAWQASRREIVECFRTV
ncbi:MAG: ABC transporter permease [Planctomycetes bacterium]|nr:ABC transporter permease [Planctomycetota bacterium]